MAIGYDLVYTVAGVLSSPYWGLKMLRTGKWRTDWAGRFGRCHPLPTKPPGGKRLLIHAVSVGEVNLTRQLVAMLREQHPQLDIVISSTTDTGFARAVQLYGQSHRVVRFPFDFTFAVRRLLNAVQPDAVALVENEVWPNFTQQCRQRGIPVCVINGRLTERSYKRYRLALALVRRMYGRLSAVAAQTQDYAQRFIGLGVPAEHVQVLDTMKWDTAQVADAVEGADELAQQMGLDRSRPIIVAGSTGPGEEKLLIDTCPPEAQLVLVPRKPERFEEVAKLDPTMTRRTKPAATNPTAHRQLFLLDTMGELRKAYALADVVIVGRSFLGLYGSDLMEPIALGKPTLIGPHHADFADVVQAMRQAGGVQVTDQPGEQAAALLRDPQRAAALAKRGREVILSRQGATARHAVLLARLLHLGD